MPDAEWIYKTYNSLRDKVYSRMVSNMNRWDDLYEGIVACHEPEGEPVHIPPIALREIHKAANQLSSDAISYEVTPNDTAAQRSSADLMKVACQRTIDESTWVNEADVLRELDTNIVHRGMGVLKGPFCDLSRMESGEWPFIVTPIDPLNFLPDPAGRYVIEAQDRLSGEVVEDIRRWNYGKDGEPYSLEWSKHIKDDFESVLWLEYYSASERCFAVGYGNKAYEVSGVQRNLYGYIPYAWSYSGWGKGRASARPELRAIGRLSGMESSIEALARSYTALNSQLRYHVYGKFVAPKGAADDLSGGRVQTGPMGITFLEPEHLPSQLTGLQLWPTATVNPDLYSYVGMSTRDIEGLGGHPALQGQGPADESGLKAMTRIRQAAMDYGPPRRAKEAILSRLFTNLARLFNNEIILPPGKDQAVSVEGRRSLKTGDLDQNARVRAILEFKDPVYDRENIELGLSMLERGAITMQMFADIYGKFPNAGTLLAELAAEQLIKAAIKDPNSPLAEQLMARVMEAHGIDQAALQMADMAQKQSLGSGGKQTIRLEKRQQRLSTPAGETSPVDMEGGAMAEMMEGVGGPTR